MLAVGVLVPLSHGRLGKNWRHAAGLKGLVRYSPNHGSRTLLGPWRPGINLETGNWHIIKMILVP